MTRIFWREPLDGRDVLILRACGVLDGGLERLADVVASALVHQLRLSFIGYHARLLRTIEHLPYLEAETQDRKSTRLNSSHVRISYAVFCLKKKKIQDRRHLYRSDRPALYTDERQKRQEGALLRERPE